tara:strand:- start:1121 stop:1366 length:246 start_codon:yes stop_codon:yes gene_type:complete
MKHLEKFAPIFAAVAFLYVIINGGFWITASLTSGARQDKTREEIKEYINQTVQSAITERFPKSTGKVVVPKKDVKNGSTNK